MTLPPEQIRLVLAGKKTQMRVPVTAARTVRRGNGTSYLSQPQRFPVGKPHAIRGDVTVVVTDSMLVELGAITQRDAIAEGHKTTDAFRIWWVTTHDKAWINRYVLKHDSVPSEDMALARFDAHHATRDVWALTFVLDREQKPRMLHRNSEQGYTRNTSLALDREPEAVDEITQARLTAAGRQEDEARKAGVDERLFDQLRSIRSHRALLLQVAGERGLDVRSEVRMIDRGYAAVERKIREQAQGRQAAA